MQSWQFAWVLVMAIAALGWTGTEGAPKRTAQVVSLVSEQADAADAAMLETVGQLEWVNPREGEVVVAAKTLRVDHTTTVFVSGRTGNLVDLRPGQVVRASYEPGAAVQWLEVTQP